MHNIYTIDYFINKFTAIPDELWTTNTYGDLVKDLAPRCAMGHCNFNGTEKFKSNPEVRALIELFSQHYCDVTGVNDAHYRQFNQTTPKARILAALNYFKELEK